MKNVLLFLMVLTTLTATAQKGATSLSIGLNHGTSLNDNLTNRLGQNIALHFGIGKKSNLNINYTTFQNKIKLNNSTVTNRFLTLGYQHYFSTKRNFFGTAEAGVSIGDTKTQPLVALGTGYSLPLNRFSKLELGAKYFISKNNAFNNNWLLLNVALKINFGKK